MLPCSHIAKCCISIKANINHAFCGCSGRHARHNKCLSTAGVYTRILVMDTWPRCFHSTILFFFLFHNKYRLAYISRQWKKMHFLCGFLGMWIHSQLPGDWQSCWCVIWLMPRTHKCTSTHTIPRYLFIFVVWLAVISVQIKVPHVGQPDSLAFINWSALIQLLSLFISSFDRSRAESQTLALPPRSPKTAHGPRPSRLTELMLVD